MDNTLKILMILTSHAKMGDTDRATGLWFEELAAPYYVFIDAGMQVDLASIAGGKVPIDPHSLQAAGGNPASVERFLKDAAAMGKLNASIKLDNIDGGRYAAMFLPGGHGTMWDLPGNARLASLLSRAWADRKVLGAVCHGPAGLVDVRDANGQPVVAGRRMTAFTDAEEVAAGLTQVVPFALETRLRSLGARFAAGANFAPHALRDGQLVTGQNPASSEAAAHLVLAALRDVAAT